MINKITIIGAGYVGFSLAVLLSQSKEVVIHDTDFSKLKKIDEKLSPIEDSKIDEFFRTKKLDLKTCNNLIKSIDLSDLVILALPTNFIEEIGSFDTSIIESVASQILTANPDLPIVIKSTVPIGFTKKISSNFLNSSIIFSPEFLREGMAIEDNLNPQRIIVGNIESIGKEIAELFSLFALNNPKIFLMNSDEAEAVKLFSNSYLATRVSFFNELDSYALKNKMDSKAIIDGVISDSRIGSGYSNPSFGYGGYCLPKDTKQLESSYNSTPQEIFSAIIKSNNTRKKYLAEHIASLDIKLIGIYRLIMKKDSSNFRESAIVDIIEILKRIDKSISIIIYEPLLLEEFVFDCKVISSMDEFKERSELIIANRFDDDLESVRDRVFSRDIYGEY